MTDGRVIAPARPGLGVTPWQLFIAEHTRKQRSTMNTGTRIQHVNLMVDDLARAVEFYGTALGLPYSSYARTGLCSSVLQDQRPPRDSSQSVAGRPTGASSFLPSGRRLHR